jgi:hypothetical protein
MFATSSLLDDLISKSIEKRNQDRGTLFEDDVQRMIDQTYWKPSELIRKWKGRKIFAGDKLITDIDAIGEHRGKLLLIECKATYYTLSHGPAPRSEVRNARETVETAVRRCSKEELTQVTNVDLSGFNKIIRVVVTPMPIYVAAEYAVRQGSDFPPSISYWELYEYLAHTT